MLLRGSLVLCLCLGWLSVGALAEPVPADTAGRETATQQVSAEPAAAPANEQRTAETPPSSTQSLLAPTDQLHLKTDPVRGDGSSMGAATGQMIIGLAAVLAVIFALAWLAKRFNLNVAGTVPNMRVVGSLNVGPKEKLLLVDVEGQRMLLGVTGASISLLRELGEGDTQAPKTEFADKMQALLKSGPLHEKP